MGGRERKEILKLVKNNSTVTLIYQGSMIQVTINLISVHLLLLLLLTSYARIVTKRPGTPKKVFNGV